MKKTIFISYLLIIVIALFNYCNKPRSNVINNTLFMNISDSAKYVGMHKCKQCHSQIFETYIKTGMGSSFGDASPHKSAASYTSHHTVYDSINNLYYAPYFVGDSMYIKEFRKHNNDTIYMQKVAIAYIIGSGQHTNSHLINRNGYIYQAPITFYTQEKKWDLAPGFEKGRNTRFNRIITDECMSCHNGYSEYDTNAENKFGVIAQGIDCERCHGPGSVHVHLKESGVIIDTSKYFDYSIVNPRALERDKQLDVCQRCHLQGITILNDDKTFKSFQPGMNLQDVMNVFLPRYTDSDQRFLMASQADKMRQSQCFQKSDMTCITCHNPHISVLQTSEDWWQTKCLQCHTAPKTICNASNSHRNNKGNNCVACHMPWSESIDIPHVKIHDHKIRVHINKVNPTAISQFIKLECVTQSSPSYLLQAQGYLSFYEEYTPAPVFLDSAKYYIDKSNDAPSNKFNTLIRYYYLYEKYDDIIRETESIEMPKNNDDAWTLYRIGEAYLNRQDYQHALYYFNRALYSKPKHIDFLNKKGIALLQLKKFNESQEIFKNINTLQSSFASSWCNLGFVYLHKGLLDDAHLCYDKALEIDPDYLQALFNKAGLLLLQRKKSEAKHYIERAELINNENPILIQLKMQLKGI